MKALLLLALLALSLAAASADAFTVTACAPEIPGEANCWNSPGPSSLRLVGPLPSQDVIQGEASGEFKLEPEIIFHDISPGDYVLKASGCNPFGCLVDTPVSVVDQDVFVIANMVSPTPAPTRPFVPTPSPSPTPTLSASACIGDCDGSGAVTVDELIILVNVALGNVPRTTCLDGQDPDAGGDPTISEIMAAVNNALNGCLSVCSFRSGETAYPCFPFPCGQGTFPACANCIANLFGLDQLRVEVTACTYYGESVYYISPQGCCDLSSILVCANGRVVCSPDGGLTGRGDGRCPDFFERACCPLLNHVMNGCGPREPTPSPTPCPTGPGIRGGVGSGGQAVAGATITCESEDGSVMAMATSSGAGFYELPLPVGRYHCQVSHPGFETFSTGAGFEVVEGSCFETANFFLTPLTPTPTAIATMNPTPLLT